MIIDKKLWWVILLLTLLVIIASLNLPMIVNAAKYAQVSREILESGDWINLTIAGDAYDQKPPLLFWIGAVFFQFFGVSGAVFKISVLLFSLLGIYSTYRLASLLYSPATGLIAAMFWFTSLAFLHFHNDVHTDTLLADLVVFSIWQLAAFFNNRKILHFILGIIGVGLSMLSKGPVGLAIPAFAVFFHLVANRQWNDIFNIRWVWAAPIVAIIITPALLGLFNQFGIEGIRFYFWTNNMGRITGSYAGANSDPFFYIHNALYLLAPYTIFAFAGIILKIGQIFVRKSNTETFNEFYTLGGILPYIIVLSAAKAKNPHYIMAVIPLIMILAANFTEQFANGTISKKLNLVVTVLNRMIVVGLWLLISLFAFYIYPETRLWFWIVIAIYILITLHFAYKSNKITREIALLSLTLLVFMFSLNVSFMPTMGTYHAPFQAVADYNQKMKNQEQLHIYRPAGRYWEVFFYGNVPGKYFITPQDLPKLLTEKEDWIFTDAIGKDQILAQQPDVQIIAEYNHRALNKQTPKFLNPKTRASKLEKRYLLKLP